MQPCTISITYFSISHPHYSPSPWIKLKKEMGESQIEQERKKTIVEKKGAVLKREMWNFCTLIWSLTQPSSLSFFFFFFLFGFLENVTLKSVILNSLLWCFYATSFTLLKFASLNLLLCFALTFVWFSRKLRENSKIQTLNATIFSTIKHIKRKTTKTKDKIKQFFDMGFPRIKPRTRINWEKKLWLPKLIQKTFSFSTWGFNKPKP